MNFEIFVPTAGNLLQGKDLNGKNHKKIHSAELQGPTCSTLRGFYSYSQRISLSG